MMIKCADAILVRVGFPVLKSLPLPTLDREHQQDFAGAISLQSILAPIWSSQDLYTSRMTVGTPSMNENPAA